jgi:acyl-CoA thioesterase FadM
MVVEVTAGFHAPARGDEIDLAVAVESLGRTSMITEHRITRDGGLLVEGRMVRVFVSGPTHEKTEIPAPLHRALEGGVLPVPRTGRSRRRPGRTACGPRYVGWARSRSG